MSEKPTPKTLDERFTDSADAISEGMGKWQVSVLAALLIIVWTLYCMFTQGPTWWYSQYYNFPLNLVTTVAELFIGFLVAAAANRVERHHNQLLYEIKARASADLHVSAEDAATNKATSDDIQAIKAELAAIRHVLAKKVLDE